MGSGSTPVSPEALLAEVEWVRRVARALVGRGESDEVVQQTYLQALATPPASGPLRSWLATVVRNVVRRRARDEETRGRHERRAPVPARTPEPGETVARAELHRRVVETVLALEEPYRSTLLLRFFEDQPAEAIARAQAIPVETVRTRVKRGLAQLRARLEREAGGDDAAGMAARALWFERLSAFAGDGAKGAVAGGAALGAAGMVAMTARAVWIASGLTAAVAVVAAAWWAHARSARRSDSGAISQTQAIAPSVAAASAAAPPSAPPAAATRTTELAPAATVASPAAAMKPLVGGPRGVVRGRVIDARGEPVAGAEVKARRGVSISPLTELNDYAGMAWREWTSSHPRPEDPGSVVTRTDAAGGFEFRGLSTFVDWNLFAFEPTHGAAILGWLLFDPEPVSQEVELKLRPGALVHGTVRDEEGRPIADASVGFGHAYGQEANRTSSWTIFFTAADGTWSAGYCCDEQVAAIVEASGFVRSPPQWTPLTLGRTDVDLEISLHSTGETIVEGPIVVAGAAKGAARDEIDLDRLLADEFGSAEERSGMRPPPGFGRIDIGAAGSDDPRPVVGSVFPTRRFIGRVDVVHARYELPLPADFRGTLFLTVKGTVVGVAPIESVSRPPPLPFDAKQIPPSQARTDLVVHVVDVSTREPVDLARGWIMATGPLHTVFSSIPPRGSTAGVAEFVAAPGRVKIRADIAGCAATAAEVVIAAGERRHEFTLALDRATAGLRGRALRSDGSYVQQSHISLYRVTPDGVVEAGGSVCSTNMYGEFEIVGLAAAEHVIVVTAPDEACAVARVRAADPPTEIELKAVPGTRTEIHLKLPGPAASAASGSFINQMFRIVDEDSIPLIDMFGGWSSSSGGTETLEAMLRPGSYHLLVWRDGFRESSLDFDVPSDEPIELELERAR